MNSAKSTSDPFAESVCFAAGTPILLNVADPSGLDDKAVTPSHSVVITYFTPFGDRTENTSKDVAEKTAEYLRKKLASIGVGPDVTVIVEVSQTGLFKWPAQDPQLEAWKKEGKIVDLWLALGEEHNLERPEVETRAKNYFYGPTPPNRKVIRGKIDPSGPQERRLAKDDRYFTEFVKSLEDVGYGNLDDAGSYSCNAILYQMLASQQKYRDTLKEVMFMHVPELHRTNPFHSAAIDDYAKKIADKIFYYLSHALE